MFEGPIQNLIDELGKLPGIGPKGAMRIAFHIVTLEPSEIERLESSLHDVRQGVTHCQICGNVSEAELCGICSDSRRDLTTICVVEESKDVQAIERTREFRGRYHVLGGALDPVNGIGPEQLRMRQLLTRVASAVQGPGGEMTDMHIAEVILATNPTTTGEATAAYLARTMREFPGLAITRLATGLSMGGDIEFADELTLGRALVGRRAM